MGLTILSAMTGSDDNFLHFYADNTLIYLPLRPDEDRGCWHYITQILTSLYWLSVSFRI